MDSKVQIGFSLIELMVTIAILVTLWLAAPASFRNLISDNSMTAKTNQFTTAISIARSEAIRRGTNVSLVAITPLADNEWGNGGWNIIEDGTGILIRSYAMVPQSNNTQMDAPGDQTVITYNQRGLLQSPTTEFTIDICDSRTAKQGRQITINPAGRPDLNRFFTCS